MEMPPGPPPLGAPAPPPPPPERYVEAEVVEPADERQRARDDEAANRRLVATTAALALLAVAVMIAAFLLTDESSSDEPAAGVAPPVTVATATTAEPPPEVDPDELDQVVAELRSFVERERGLEFTEDVELTILNGTDYQERIGDEFDEDFEDEELELATRQLFSLREVLGLWNPVDDPVSTLREYAVAGSLGFYDPESDEMVIRGTALTPLLRSTLVHELVHALDDQHFDLDQPELERRTDESPLAFSAVVEGDARRVELAYVVTLSSEDQQAIGDEAAALVQDAGLDEFPPILEYEQTFVYESGRAFVEALVADGGSDAVDDALQDPPDTSEEVMEPATFALDLPTGVPELPEADGEVVGSGTVGQLTLIGLTELEEGDTSGPEWNGDAYVLWRDPEANRLCGRIVVSGDVDGFEAGLDTWASQRGAELVQQEGILLITICPELTGSGEPSGDGS